VKINKEKRAKQIDLSARGSYKWVERKQIWIVINPFPGPNLRLVWLGLMKLNRWCNRLSANLLFVVSGFNWLACALWLLFINFDCNHHRTNLIDKHWAKAAWLAAPPAAFFMPLPHWLHNFLRQGRPGPLVSSGKQLQFKLKLSFLLYLFICFRSRQGTEIAAPAKKHKKEKTLLAHVLVVQSSCFSPRLWDHVYWVAGAIFLEVRK